MLYHPCRYYKEVSANRALSCISIALVSSVCKKTSYKFSNFIIWADFLKKIGQKWKNNFSKFVFFFFFFFFIFPQIEKYHLQQCRTHTATCSSSPVALNTLYTLNKFLYIACTWFYYHVDIKLKHQASD